MLIHPCPTSSIQHPLPSDPTSSKAAARAAKPLLALTPLVHPLILRFRWHFDGTRGTNRIDKVSRSQRRKHSGTNASLARVSTVPRPESSVDTRALSHRGHSRAARHQWIRSRRCDGESHPTSSTVRTDESCRRTSRHCSSRYSPLDSSITFLSSCRSLLSSRTRSTKPSSSTRCSGRESIVHAGM